jgi:predicted site-specific integrase-resolvase
MSELNINQVQKILGITYPTAHKMAREFGRFDKSVPPNGKWFIPASVIRKTIFSELQTARLKESRYLKAIESIGNGNQ